jgi:hypothetical protein
MALTTMLVEIFSVFQPLWRVARPFNVAALPIKLDMFDQAFPNSSVFSLTFVHAMIAKQLG